MGYNFGFGGFFGMILMVLFWVGIIVLAIWLVSKLTSGSASRNTNVSEPTTSLSQPPLVSASELLKQRYVRGEITKEQFEDMRRSIEA